jgi:drug/metabolite transporter (DMT)-like permease
VTVRKYLVLLAIVIFGATGDALLSRGMKEVGEIHLNDWHELIYAIGDPWVLGGIVLLLGFFASYLTALSWADLTYVLPATAIGYVVLALIAKFYLHEHISLMRWAGILLITAGVGFVATGPALTEREEDVAPVEKIGREA